MQYVLVNHLSNKSPDNLLWRMSSSSLVSIAKSTTDKLLRAVWDWFVSDKELVWVFEWHRGWYHSKDLWTQVKQTTWSSAVLDADLKKDLTQVAHRFFDSRDLYKANGIPWKRGLIFHGPPGNGKTLCLKAFMHSLVADQDPKDRTPCLYIKGAPSTFFLKCVFESARAMAPCLLVFEDVEAIVTPHTRSFFFNEVDGLENNDGILMIATTSHLERVDPGSSKRPSRFDRTYLFPEPTLDLRILYCEYWHGKIKIHPTVDFPKHLCRHIALITYGFSFAYMQEAFAGALLTTTHRDNGDGVVSIPKGFFSGCGGVCLDDGQDDPGDPDEYEFFRTIKSHVKELRGDMDGNSSPHDYHERRRPTLTCPPGPSSPTPRVEKHTLCPPCAARAEYGLFMYMQANSGKHMEYSPLHVPNGTIHQHVGRLGDPASWMSTPPGEASKPPVVNDPRMPKPDMDPHCYCRELNGAC